MTEKLLSPGDEWRLSVAGRTQRELDAERRRGRALADAVREHIDANECGTRLLDEALKAWDSR